ncbi:hypothetical protein [Methanosarcina sp. KYL-1]|uniref:hypothetical protein n=1 Tax=Methanosarcina sp. KYL-1 TaxID=2602068 RepID=UPI002100E897|nr:hypothetical protein [Methanosarcina sp. KYL-1]
MIKKLTHRKKPLLKEENCQKRDFFGEIRLFVHYLALISRKPENLENKISKLIWYIFGKEEEKHSLPDENMHL